MFTKLRWGFCFFLGFFAFFGFHIILVFVGMLRPGRLTDAQYVELDDLLAAAVKKMEKACG